MSAASTTANHLTKHIELKAPRARVWRALTSANEFATWFRLKLDGDFAAGKTVRGTLTYPGYEHVTIEMQIQRIEPETLFSYRWHPHAIDQSIDYSTEPMTLVEFRLADVAGGTSLTVVESGFDAIPAFRRDQAFLRNSGGWAQQLENIARHVAGA